MRVGHGSFWETIAWFVLPQKEYEKNSMQYVYQADQWQTSDNPGSLRQAAHSIETMAPLIGEVE
jgi:hypothetical protein